MKSDGKIKKTNIFNIEIAAIGGVLAVVLSLIAGVTAPLLMILFTVFGIAAGYGAAIFIFAKFRSPEKGQFTWAPTALEIFAHGRQEEHKSYIDKDTGDIFLRSPLFPSRRSKEWALCLETKTLTISHNVRVPSQRDLFSAVHQPWRIIPLSDASKIDIELTDTLDPHSLGGELRLRGSSTYDSPGAGGVVGGLRPRFTYSFPLSELDKIDVHVDDRDIAKKIYDCIVAHNANLR
ncbi:MAG: hypothetical protein FWE19_02260 [Oscillospiraceae bacterium]|nr:hypothetical protein [Oscillospiraceae bacterium]